MTFSSQFYLSSLIKLKYFRRKLYGAEQIRGLKNSLLVWWYINQGWYEKWEPGGSVYGRVSQISAIYLFLCVFYAILRCISFKIRVNFLIELLRIYKTMVLTSFFDFIQAPSMRVSLILHLNFAHIKPQQPNPVILVTILGQTPP